LGTLPKHLDNLEFLRMKEAERIDFARTLRQELGEVARNWAHKDVDDAESPLGRYFADISDHDWVGLIADPDKLFDFTTRACEELFTLAGPISIGFSSGSARRS